jgi:hypothetical protein
MIPEDILQKLLTKNKSNLSLLEDKIEKKKEFPKDLYITLNDHLGKIKKIKN